LTACRPLPTLPAVASGADDPGTAEAVGRGSREREAPAPLGSFAGETGSAVSEATSAFLPFLATGALVTRAPALVGGLAASSAFASKRMTGSCLASCSSSSQQRLRCPLPRSRNGGSSVSHLLPGTNFFHR